MMIFNEDYFLPEDRNGFHIRSMIKRAWACQLDMLEQVDAICNRHGIHYFLDSGTLLGAVREKGYIEQTLYQRRKSCFDSQMNLLSISIYYV